LESDVQAKIPQLSVQQAGIQTISIGQLGLGPITVGNLVLSNLDFSLNAAQAVLHNMNVTVTLHLSLEWHVHVGLPDGIPDIDIGDTYDLGSPSFSLPVGNVTIPALSNLQFHIPSVNAQNLAVNASPLTLQLTNLSAEDIHASNAVAPTAGFTISGLTLTSLGGNGIGLPDATVAQATVGHVHGDPAKIPAFALGGLQLPAVQIPSISSTIPLNIPANLQGPSVGVDGGLLRILLHIQPSVLIHIQQLDITGANAAASVGQVVLHDVTLPYDVRNLTLSQIGIDTISIPSFTIA
jgi:hypothetical protein